MSTPLFTKKQIPLTINNPKQFYFGLTLICLLAGLWRIYGIEGYIWDYDEGANLAAAWMVKAGYTLYSQTFYAHPPLFIASLQTGFWLGGETIATGRLVVIAYSLLGIMGVAWWGRLSATNATGLWAAFLLAFIPSYFFRSRVAVMDVPAVSLTVLMLPCLLMYYRSGLYRWMLVSGVLLALSWLLKPLTLFVPLLPALAIVGHNWQCEKRLISRQVIEAGLIFTFGLVAPFIITVLAVDWRDFYEQSVALRVQVRDVYKLDMLENARVISLYLLDNWALVLLAGMGLLTNWRTNPLLIASCLVWFFGGWAMLLVHSPLREQHLLIYLPPLVLLAAAFWGERKKRHPGVYSIGLLLLGWFTVTSLQANWAVTWSPQSGRAEAVVALLQTISAPGDFIVTDEPALAFLAKRPLPPPMADPSLVIIRSGYLNADKAREITETYTPTALVPWSGRFAARLEPYLTWAKGQYAANHIYDDQHQLFFAYRQQPSSVTASPQAIWANGLSLLNVRWNETGWWQQEETAITLTWLAEKPLAENYTIFIQFLDDKGNLVLQNDAPPLAGLLPTTIWEINTPLADPHYLSIPLDLPAGQYQVILGFYNPETMERLLLVDETQTPLGDYAVLGALTKP